MQKLQLFINDTQVDLFNDESVSITQTIKNVRDIEKVFTDFTKQFTIPASKENNKVFKHYYNYHIVNGFDGRKKVSAEIQLNNLPFRKGKLKLDGVDMRNNAPYAYRVTFFGNTVNLKDLIGEDELSDLDYSAFTELDGLIYNPTTIKSKLQADPASNNLITPLITYEQQLYYNSAAPSANSGNLYYTAATDQGVKWNQLKYALRLNRFIEAIEDTYGLTFSSDFFKNASNDHFYNLFMWLHRKKGAVEGLSEGTETTVDAFTTPGGQNDPYFTMFANQTLIATLPPANLDLMTLTCNVASGDESIEYSIRITRDLDTVYESGTITGDKTVIEGTDFTYSEGSYQVYITTSDADLDFSYIDWNITYDTTTSISFSAPNFTAGSEFVFAIAQQVPKMKVLDFLSAMFKMFNLVAVVEDDDTIYVDTLDNFYTNKVSQTTAYDITDYVDNTKGQINVALPYKEINFLYKDTKTILANKYSEIVNKDWGETSYEQQVQIGDNNVTGDIYKVEIPFHHAQFERLNNLADSSSTVLMYGLFVDADLNSYFGSPLVFYPVRVDAGTDGYSIVDELDINGDAAAHSKLQYCNVPSNSVALSPATSTKNIHFTEEVNEYTSQTGFTGSLFEEYYKTYIENIFDFTNRLSKVTAYLPLKILLNYTLADKFIIADKQYKINSIQTNLTNGKSEIELIND